MRGRDEQNKDEAAVERAARELARVERTVGWERVGKVASVVTEYLGATAASDHAACRARRLSVRRLAAHPLCPLSKTRLDEILAAQDVYRNEPLVRRSHLSPSHVAAVARLHAGERRTLLLAAVDEQWSVRELKQRARSLRRHRGERRGRPPTSLEEKAKTRIENAGLLLEEAGSLLSETQALSQRGAHTGWRADAEWGAALLAALDDISKLVQTCRSRLAPERPSVVCAQGASDLGDTSSPARLAVG